MANLILGPAEGWRPERQAKRRKATLADVIKSRSDALGIPVQSGSKMDVVCSKLGNSRISLDLTAAEVATQIKVPKTAWPDGFLELLTDDEVQRHLVTLLPAFTESEGAAAVSLRVALLDASSNQHGVGADHRITSLGLDGVATEKRGRRLT